MRAISLKQPWANLIAEGTKTIETRKWATDFRGDVVIVSSKKPDIPPAGAAVAIVEIYDCIPMTIEHEEAACCEIYENAYAWKLRNIRRIKNPFSVKGQLKFYNVNLPANLDLETVY